MSSDAFTYGIINEARQSLKDAISFQKNGYFGDAELRRQRYDELIQKLAERFGVSADEALEKARLSPYTLEELDQSLAEYDKRLDAQHRLEGVDPAKTTELERVVDQMYYGPSQDTPYSLVTRKTSPGIPERTLTADLLGTGLTDSPNGHEDDSVEQLFARAFERLMQDEGFEPEDIRAAELSYDDGLLQLDVEIRRSIQVSIEL